MTPYPDLIHKMREAGIRVTSPRRAIAQVLEQAGEHLDVLAITRRAREVDPRVHSATVYRTLRLLERCGLVDELDLMHARGDRHYYELRQRADHAHVICRRCGTVQEMGGEFTAGLARRLTTQSGFQIDQVRLEAGGLCPVCRERGEE